MHLNALLDIDVAAVEIGEEVSTLIELTAPERSRANGAPATLQIVLDRSSSMADGRLEVAQLALDGLIDRLDPESNFGLVVFDGGVEVVVPAGEPCEKDAIREALRAIQPGAGSNLSAGLLRGIQEARRVMGDGNATLVLLSDGHANAGITDPDELERVTAGALGAGLTTATVGMGSGYDRERMALLARGGSGGAHFAEEPEVAAAAIATAADALLEQSVQAVSLTVRPMGVVEAIHVYDDLPASAIDSGFMLELGDFYSGERRSLPLTLDIPALSTLGLAQVCELELQWVDIKTLGCHTVTIPLYVNVVPGDQAAGRVTAPTVRSEPALDPAPTGTGGQGAVPYFLFDHASSVAFDDDNLFTREPPQAKRGEGGLPLPGRKRRAARRREQE